MTPTKTLPPPVLHTVPKLKQLLVKIWILIFRLHTSTAIYKSDKFINKCTSKGNKSSYRSYTLCKCLKTNKSNENLNCIKKISLKGNSFTDDYIKDFTQKCILIEIT